MAYKVCVQIKKATNGSSSNEHGNSSTSKLEQLETVGSTANPVVPECETKCPRRMLIKIDKCHLFSILCLVIIILVCLTGTLLWYLHFNGKFSQNFKNFTKSSPDATQSPDFQMQDFQDSSSYDASEFPSKVEDLDLVRLPRNVQPRHYDLEIQPFLFENFTYNGKVIINIKCLIPTKTITLHILNLTIGEIRVLKGDFKELDVEKIETNDEYQFLIIKLKKKLIINDFYNVSINFVGILDDSEVGFYRSSYLEEGKKK